MSPIFEKGFSERSYGFSPGRSAHQAVEASRKHVAEGKRWVVDMDLKKFFDRVNHDTRISRVSWKIEDKRVLKLIRRYLKVGIMTDGAVSVPRQGTPQGALCKALHKEARYHRFCRTSENVQRDGGKRKSEAIFFDC